MRFFTSKKIWIFVLAAICGLFYPIYLRFWQQPELTVCGFIDMTDGLGRQSIELIEAFQEEFTISFIPTRPNRFADVPSGLQKIMSCKKDRLGKVVIFEDLLWWPQEEKYRKLVNKTSQDSIRIAYSMFE